MRIPPNQWHKQQGMTLLIAMIMLILITLLALSAIRLSNSNLKVVANSQYRMEATAAANFALDAVENTPTISAMVAAPKNVDIGGATYTVTVSKPACKRYRTIPKKEMVTTSATGVPSIAKDDTPCFTGSDSGSVTFDNAAAAAGAAGDSLCAGILWEIEAKAAPTAGQLETGATVTLREGIEQRVAVTDAVTSCK